MKAGCRTWKGATTSSRRSTTASTVPPDDRPLCLSVVECIPFAPLNPQRRDDDAAGGAHLYAFRAGAPQGIRRDRARGRRARQGTEREGDGQRGVLVSP